MKTTASDLPPKPKSRFALQREKEAAEAQAAARASRGREKFTIDFDAEEDVEEHSNVPRIVGEVIERDSDLAPPLPPSAPRPSVLSPLLRKPGGFPSSARLSTSLESPSPSVPSSALPPETSTPLGEVNSIPALLSTISASNENVLAGMSEREILEEQRQIRESMGLSAGVLKMLEERARQKEVQKPSPSPTSSRNTRPPVGPVRAPKVVDSEQEAEEEGTPEYIRRHFFPNEPPNPNLDWMRGPVASNSTSPLQSATSDSRTNLAFDIQGSLVSSSALSPTDHSETSSHHVSSSTTFTIPALLSLTTSAVPTQRSTALLVLSKILENKAHATTFGTTEWTALRHACVLRAGRGIRDSHLLVSSTSLSLLALAFELELSSPTPITTPLISGAEIPPTLLDTFLSTDPYPTLSQHLSLPSLSPTSLSTILSLLSNILFLSSRESTQSLPVEELVSSPLLLERLSRQTISLAWPPSPSTSSPKPIPSAIGFLSSLASSSRARAKALWERGLVEPPLRFLAVLPWELDVGDISGRSLGHALVDETLSYWTVMARYGLAAGLRTRGADLLQGLFDRFSKCLGAEGEKLENEDWNCATRWLELLRIWTVAAVDPHVTEHDITWTQVEDWNEAALEAVRFALGRGVVAEKEKKLFTAGIELLASWLEGSKMNKPWKGEEERKWVEENVGKAFTKGGRIESLIYSTMEDISKSGTAVDAALDVALVLSSFHLSEAYEEDSTPSTAPLLKVDPALRRQTVRSILTWTEPSRTSTGLLLCLLPLETDTAIRLGATLDVLSDLGLGDEIPARDLVNWVCTTLSSDPTLPFLSSLDPQLELPSLSNVAILRPFITHALVTVSGGRVVGPLHPTPRDLKLTASLYPFASSSARLLADGWPLVVLNELLRSSTSPVFKQLPTGWDATELQLVRSALALMRVVSCVPRLKKGSRAPALIYDLIKVFMLEKDNTTTGTAEAESDLFRDEGIDASVVALLSTLQIRNLPNQQLRLVDNRTPAATIEGVSSLVSSAPFYRLYTDLVGLYDSVSLGHTSFSQVLLPPLSMSYAADYRKLLWIDYSHLLRTIRIPVLDVVSDKEEGEGALSSYLFPLETDRNVLGAYGEAIVSGKVTEEDNGFLFFVALHHVVGVLFGSREEEKEGDSDSQIRSKLARAIVGQGRVELVRKVLRLKIQKGDGGALEIPMDRCLEEVEVGRLELLKEMLDEKGRAKLVALEC